MKNKNDLGWDRLPHVLRHPTVLQFNLFCDVFIQILIKTWTLLFRVDIQPGAVKLVLWRHLMHLTQVHPVTSENQFHCTRLCLLLLVWWPLVVSLCVHLCVCVFFSLCMHIHVYLDLHVYAYNFSHARCVIRNQIKFSGFVSFYFDSLTSSPDFHFWQFASELQTKISDNVSGTDHARLLFYYETLQACVSKGAEDEVSMFIFFFFCVCVCGGGGGGGGSHLKVQHFLASAWSFARKFTIILVLSSLSGRHQSQLSSTSSRWRSSRLLYQACHPLAFFFSSSSWSVYMYLIEFCQAQHFLCRIFSCPSLPHQDLTTSSLSVVLLLWTPFFPWWLQAMSMSSPNSPQNFPSLWVVFYFFLVLLVMVLKEGVSHFLRSKFSFVLINVVSQVTPVYFLTSL